MSRPAEELLEFDRLKEILSRYSTCAPGRRALAALSPCVDRDALEAAFALIREAMAYMRAGSELGFGSLADPAAWLAHLGAPVAVLAPADLLDAASLMDATASLKQSFRQESAKFPLLARQAAGLADFRSLAAAIRKAVLPNGEISDDASTELKRIRQTIGRTRDKVQKTLREILRARGEEPGEDYITLRNDRFVIPVRAADRRRVPGVVHAASATGQTVFLEPFDAVELNNRLVQLAEDEAAEIARILAALTEHLRDTLGPLQFAASTIANLDSIFARARFARAFDCALPEFAAEQRIRLDGARHPVLEDNLKKQGRSIVPITLALGGRETVMVISGPNTGGKTVALKTAGLAALAAQSGIPVAAERAELPLFDRVLADIGDEQSISADLSTFSAHVLNLRAILDAATPSSLVLADELGTGTAPEEGSALAVALLEEFRARGCLTLATTHHDRLKAWASTSSGVLNAAVEFDEANLRPTYRLLLGVPGGSSGISIAQRLGLPAPIIARASALISAESHEAGGLIAYLHRSRDELDALRRQMSAELALLEDNRRKLQTEWAERQRKRLADLEKNFAELLKRYEQEIKQLVGEVKDRELRAKLEKQSGRRLSKLRADVREEANAAVVQHLAESQPDLGPQASSRAAPEPVSPKNLQPGARLRVRGLAQPVVLRHFDPATGSAEIQAGPLRMKVPLADVTEIVSEKGNEKRENGKRVETSTSGGVARLSRGGAVDACVPDEINVIGCTVEEAAARVDKFLDQAVLANKPRVRIIHGHGTGALRRGLAAFLKEHPLVESVAAEDPERGGDAVTIVQLRRD